MIIKSIAQVRAGMKAMHQHAIDIEHDGSGHG